MKLKLSKPEILWNCKTFLGEGITYDSQKKTIYFVDIKKKKIKSINIINNKKKIIQIDKEIGFIFNISEDKFILGLKGELRIINLKTKKKNKYIILEKDKPDNRLNDGCIDPQGRLWFGTMDNKERNIKNGSLYCLDRKLNLTKVDENYIIPNGPVFINKFNFYHTDSRKKTIYKIKINKNLKIIQKKIFKKFSKKSASPDGMVLDIKKNLWVCRFGTGSISIFNRFAKKIGSLKLPAKNITNCTFGGKNNSNLFIITARKKMKKNDYKKYIFSGALIKVKTNTKGIIQKKFYYNL